MSSDIRESILKTLVYSDIFDYPLTLDEIWKFYIGNKTISKNRINKEFENINLVNSINNHWFFIRDRDKIVKTRWGREKESKKKYKLVQKVAGYFSYLPSIFLIGISGALAMNNASKDDDIDLFVITKKNTLFTTRLFLILFLEFMGLRRKRKDNKVSDKICLNMIIDETALSLPVKKQDLYSAHEVVQMVPLFEREDMYRKFVEANIWVKKFLPHALKYRLPLIRKQIRVDPFFSIVLNYVLHISELEFLARKIQLWSIKKHQTTEIVSDHLLAFHPYDYKTKILSEYKKRLKLYEKI